MDIDGLLKRIEARAKELGLSITAVSRQAQGADTIRNWQRKARDGIPFSMRQSSIESIAKALRVTPAWLLTGSDEGKFQIPDSQPKGLAEESASFESGQSQSLAVAAIFAGTARRAVVLRRQLVPLPGLGLHGGDLVVCDLGRDSEVGDMVLVHVEDDSPHGTTLIRRWFSPWLLAGDVALDANPLREDQPGVTIRYPVIGSIRGA